MTRKQKAAKLERRRQHALAPHDRTPPMPSEVRERLKRERKQRRKGNG